VGRGKIFLRRHLMVRGEFVKPILEGVKKATIRLGIVVPKYDEIIIHGGGRPIAKARITEVIHKKVSELTDSDAALDGFSSREELIEALKNVYGRVSPDDVVTIIKFEVIQRLDEVKSDDIYCGLNPSDMARIYLRYLRESAGEEEGRILELLSRGLSIREVAKKLYGSPEKRFRVRRAVRKALRELISRGILSECRRGRN
jgi:hypothetical protein